MPLQRQVDPIEKIREEYEVVWNGQRDDGDRDLLRVDLRQPKRDAETVKRELAKARDQSRLGTVLGVLTRATPDWLRITTVARRAEVRSYVVVQSLLEQLCQRGFAERRESRSESPWSRSDLVRVEYRRRVG